MSPTWTLSLASVARCVPASSASGSGSVALDRSTTSPTGVGARARRRVRGHLSNGRGRRSRNRPPLTAALRMRRPARRACRRPPQGCGDRPQQPPEAGQGGGQARRVGPPGVHRVEHDARRAQAARPFAHKHHLGPFGAGVGAGPREGLGREPEVVESQPLAYMPPDVIAMTRAAVGCRSSGSRPATSANGPTTSVAKVASIPSGPTERSGKIAPALSMRTSILGSAAECAATAPRTDVSEPMSATTVVKRSSRAGPRAVAHRHQALVAATDQDDPRSEGGELFRRLHDPTPR